MALLKRADILAANDIQTQIVQVPEWGGEVAVRGMTGLERDEFEASIVEGSGKKTSVKWKNIRARVASLCIVDEAGSRLFTESDIQDLGDKSAAALERVFDVARRLSGLSESDVETLEKN